MIATLLALLGAVFTAVLYAVSSERLEYGTVQRRQLDMWVAAVGFGCLVMIVFGAADVHRASGGTPTAVPTEESRPAAVSRVGEPDLYEPDDSGYVPSGGPPAIVVVPGSDDAGAAGEDGAYEGAQAYYRAGPSGPSSSGSAALGDDPFAGPSAPTTEPSTSWRGVITPVLGALPIDTPMPSAPGVVSTSDPPRPPHDPTPIPATAVPMPTEPAVNPPPPALPTPHCGDPQDIRVALSVLDAFVDRSGERTAVGYRAEVRNASPFPVTLVDISAVVESRNVGSEQFGHESVTDVTLEPGVLHRLDGRVVLTKSPPPFDLTRMCVSFVAETCGRALPYRITKHCFDTRGF